MSAMVCRGCGAAVADGARFCPSCGGSLIMPAAPAAAGDPWIGKLVDGRFRVLERLGAGGMGVVYKAEQVAMRRPVALKVLHPQLVQDAEVITRFENEAAACSRLTHPNTITVHDFGQTEDHALFIAMEFVPGESLEAVLRRGGALPYPRVIDIALQICGSLAEAHAMGIIHRDLKPGNIMLFDRPGRREGTAAAPASSVKVLDFGIAKICAGSGSVDQRAALTRTGMVFGTPQYMSPEQIKGEKVGPRSDLYSVGVILYEMLTGDLPFSAETPMGLLTKHLLEVPRPIRDAFPNISIPRSLERAVMRAMAKDPQARPESMEALAHEIELARGEAPSIPPPAPVPPTVARPIAVPPPGSLDTARPVVAPIEPVARRGAGRTVLYALVGILGLCAAGVGGWVLVSSRPRGGPIAPLAPGADGPPVSVPRGAAPAAPLPVGDPPPPVPGPTTCTLEGEGPARAVADALQRGAAALVPCFEEPGTFRLRWDLGARAAPRGIGGVEGDTLACVQRVLPTLGLPADDALHVTMDLRIAADRCTGQVHAGRPRSAGGAGGRGPKDQVLGGRR